MLVSLKEIAKYVDISDISAQEIADKLTFSGIEVENINKLANASNLVIGEVIECGPHPDSDHLHVTKVDVGDEILDIVCGAPNVRKGLKVIVARAGAILPGGEIKKGVIRGVESNGMLCALNELGVDPKTLSAQQIEGIEELDKDAVIGNQDVLGYLGLDDIILDLNLLANRSDCYAIFNVAKEIGALFNRKVNIPEIENEATYTEKEFKVSSETELCKEFYGILIKGIEIKESPSWLKNFLRSEGIRSINNVVDLGNYIMLLTGQPINMYDLDKLPKKELIIKSDFNGSFESFDDRVLELKKDDIVVVSDDKVMCLAGVMAGKTASIDKTSKNIVVELAIFNHASVRKTSIRLGVSSDSSQRFIKGLNKDQLDFVADLLVETLKKLTKYDNISNTLRFDKFIHETRRVECSLDYINKRLGTKLLFPEIEKTLNLLGFNIKNIDDNHFIALVPSSRIDIEGKADLSEEVIRYIGIDNIPSSLPNMVTTVGGKKIDEDKSDVIKNLLTNRGLYEVLTYTLINKEEANSFNYINNDESYKILNPLTSDHEYVRHNLITSLLRCASYNINHNNIDFGIYEISTIDTKKNLEEHLSVVLCGQKFGQNKMKAESFSYFDLKGIIDEILHLFNISDSRVRIQRINNGKEDFHPNKSAIVYLDGKVLAVLGDLHPLAKEKYDLKKQNVIVLEMNLSLLFNTKSGNNRFSEISKYPYVTRDYAFVIDNKINYRDLRKEIKKASSLIKDIDIFDIYKGENIQEGYVSIAISLSINSTDHTLKEEEISETDKKVRDILKSKFNVELRA